MSQSSVLPALHAESDSGPRNHPNTKRTGELAEAAFVVKAASLGYPVSKPWGDSERYDFILDAGHRTFRVQIKCTESPNANGYQVQSTYTDRKQKGHYTARDIDFLVAYILPLDLWYVVPAEAFPASASLRFYPLGNLSGRRTHFEQYREAWHLFEARMGRSLLSTNDSEAPGVSPASGQSEATSVVFNDSHPEPKRREGEGSAVEGNHCHAERSEVSAERDPNEVEAPLPSPEPPVVLPPHSSTERLMTQWSQRVNKLYHRKP